MTNASALPHATIRSDMLVLHLPDAVNPVVWQFDLARARSASIEAAAYEEGYRIRLKTLEGEVHDIALYAARDGAVAALSIVHQTLADQGRDPLSPCPPERGETNSPKGGNVRLAAAAVIVFVLLVLFLFSMSGTPPSQQIEATAQAGVPLSAEDVLKGRMP